MTTTLKDFAQELKRQAPIDQIVAEYVPSLRRAGAALKGLCPFHEEKTPSFNVRPEWGRYKCFGCGASGDVLTFIQEIEKVDFRMAVESLARRLGIALPEFRAGRTPEERDRTEELRRRLLAICALAEKFFVDRLWNGPGGAAARDYLTGRGLTEDQIKEYRLGYAPEGFDALLTEAGRLGYKEASVAEAGLAVQRDRGGFYDRFRHRIIFPIADTHGEVVAFGGRLMAGEGPKYLNSPETDIFKKGQLLYGLAAAREAIRDEGRAIVLEGYMDWIALHSHGVKHCVAGLGTAFTDGQARLLRRVCPEAVLLYDGDEAGRKAMFKTAGLLLGQSLTTRIASLAAGHDPDSHVRAEGCGATRDLIAQARPAMEFFTDVAFETHDAGRPEGKQRIAEFLAPLLRAIRDPVLGEGHVNQVAGRLGLTPATLRAKLRTRAAAAPQVPATSEAAPRLGRLECSLLNRLIRHVDLAAIFDGIDPDFFVEEALSAIFAKLGETARDIREGGETPADWLSICDDDAQITAMNHILFIEDQHAGGEIQIDPASRSPEDVLAECRQMAARLHRNQSRRLRREACHELRFRTPGPTGFQAYTNAIHAHSGAVDRATRRLTGHPEPPAGQTPPPASQV